MGRKARFNFRARSSLSQLQIRIRSQSVQDWPPYAFFAWEMLNTELGLPDIQARSVILESVLAARRCVTAQNERLSDIARVRTLRQLQTACSRISKCIKRSPAALRRNLNQALLPLLEETIDLEVLASILETARKTFEAFPHNEPSCAALQSLKGVHFSVLSVDLQDKVLGAIVRFNTAENTDRTTTHLFLAIGAAIKSENAAKTSSQIGDLMVALRCRT